MDLALDSTGNIYVTDSGNLLIRRISVDGNVSTVAGRRGNSGSVDGDRNTALLAGPFGITVDSAGTLYITDLLTIRRVTPDGFVTTVAGDPRRSGVGDGVGSAATFGSPRFITIDIHGDFYVTDTCVVRRMTPQYAVFTFAGVPGQQCFSPREGPAVGFARFDVPYGLAFDRRGNLYIADTGNRVIQRISLTGVVSVVAGESGPPAIVDGVGKSARLGGPRGLAIDRSGNIYISDFYELTAQSRAVIRKGTVEGRSRLVRR